jgi:hypothetical protein
VWRRVTIGLLIVLAVSIAVFAFTQPEPKEGTIEWHKKRYAEAEDKMRGRRWFTPLAEVYDRLTRATRAPRARDGDEIRRLQREMNSHRDALRELGYLAERKFIVSNNPSVVGHRVFAAPTVPNNRYSLISVNSSFGTNVIKITAPPAHMQKWEQLILKMDVP